MLIFFKIVFYPTKAAELTVTLGQAFELAYKRYLQKGKKQDSKENKEVNDLRKQIEQARLENELLKKQLNDGNNDVNSRRTQSSSSIGSNNSNPASTPVAPPQVCKHFLSLVTNLLTCKSKRVIFKAK